MRPQFPSLHVGNPIQRKHFVVFPLFHSQKLFPSFDDAFPGPDYAVADWRQRAKVAAVGSGIDAFTTILRNDTNTRALFLPGDELRSGTVLNCSILVPPQAEINVPALCIAKACRVSPPRGKPVSNAIGLVVIGWNCWQLDLFGTVEACRSAWTRLLTIKATGTIPAKDDVDKFVGLIHRLTWQHVRSVGQGWSWVASNRAIQASALFLGRNLIHLRAIKVL